MFLHRHVNPLVYIHSYNRDCLAVLYINSEIHICSDPWRDKKCFATFDCAPRKLAPLILLTKELTLFVLSVLYAADGVSNVHVLLQDLFEALW